MIFVIWDWKWIKEDSDSGSDTSAASILVPAFDSEDDSNSDDAPDSSEVTHSVTFKCIGSTKEQRYQEFLARIAQKRSKGEDVQCKIKPEPTNPVDSQAIAFESEIDGVWQVIGYVVKEALCDVHNALAAKKVISACMACKYNGNGLTKFYHKYVATPTQLSTHLQSTLQAMQAFELTCLTAQQHI